MKVTGVQAEWTILLVGHVCLHVCLRNVIFGSHTSMLWTTV